MNLGKKISVRLDDELVERLQGYADRERVPVSYVLRHLVLRFLSNSADKEGERVRPALRAGAPSPTFPHAERQQVEFRKEACTLFDGFRAQGHDMKEATKRTNFALKAKHHPWATYEQVASVLREAGRFRKSKGCPQG